jgi:phage/plasmid-associated DNA primase
MDYGAESSSFLSKFTGKEVPRFARRNEDFGDGPGGILTWAISGAIEYFRVGLNDPDVVKVATSDYRVGSDALSGFIGDVLIPDPEGRMTGKEIWEAYQEWTEDEGLPIKDRWRRQTVWQALEERGATRTVHARTVGFRGFRRLTVEEKSGRIEESEPFEAK